MTVRTDIAALINDNTTGDITPADVRNALTLVLDTDNALDPYGLAQYDGVADCTAAFQAVIDACFGPASSPHARAGVTQNKPLIIPPGHYNITSSLMLTKVQGGQIRGAGRFTTTLQNTAGGNVFTTNGFEYSRVEGLNLQTSGTGHCFMLDWDNSSGTTLQSNTFADMFFQGGAYGVSIGWTGYMGSENLFLNCFWGGQTVAGLATTNFNALQNTVIGGNIQGCPIGIWVHQGSVPTIISTGFQNFSGIDIQIDGASFDCYVIDGCRSESANFFKNTVGPPSTASTLRGCLQGSSTSGFFVQAGSAVLIDACYSLNGQLVGGTHVDWRIVGDPAYMFGRPDWFNSNGPIFFLGTRFPAPVNTVLPVITGTPRVGEVLTCSAGTWTGMDGPYDLISQRTWYIDGAAVGTLGAYTPVIGDLGKMIECMSVATSLKGGSSFATAAAVGPIRPVAGTFSTVYSQTLPTDSPGFAGTTIRLVLPGTMTSAAGGRTKLRLTFKGPSSGNASHIGNCFVGVKSDTYGMVSPVRVTFSSSNGVTVAVGSTVVSDQVTLTFNEADDLVIAFDFPGSPASDMAYHGGVSGITSYYKVAIDAANASPSGYSADVSDWYGISLVEAAE